jgi:hypothetical protein
VPDGEVHSRDARSLKRYIHAALEPNVTFGLKRLVHQLTLDGEFMWGKNIHSSQAFILKTLLAEEQKANRSDRWLQVDTCMRTFFT